MRASSAKPAVRTDRAASLLGRDADLRALQAALALPDIRLVTLVGPGGVGKTTLARATLGGRADAAFVDASTASNPDELTELVVAALGWEQRGQAATQRLQARLPRHHGLLVLDNLEQISGIAETVQVWLDLAPELQFLTTSRDALGVPGERVLQVEPLTLPPLNSASEADLRLAPAGELFLRHAQRVNAGFAVDSVIAREIAQLCLHLDGLPLAIELAASRMDLFTPGAALTWLEDGRLLPGVPRAGVPSRQHSVERAVRWSYDLLNPAQQRAFRQLGVFAGDFGLPAAAAVLELTEDDARGVLRELARKSLVREALPDRYELFATVRAATMKLLRDSGEEHEVRLTHGRHHAELARRLRSAYAGDPVMSLSTLKTELHNFRAALRFLIEVADGSTTELAQFMAADLSYLLFSGGHQAEARRWLTAALRMPHGTPLSRAICRGRLGGHRQGHRRPRHGQCTAQRGRA